jgi:hypothetical protein
MIKGSRDRTLFSTKQDKQELYPELIIDYYTGD